MGTIESMKGGQAKIILDDFYIRIFVKYKGKYCSEIRIWKLPKSHTFLGMFKKENLFWAVYDDMAVALNGWFYKKEDLLVAIAHKIEKCSNEKDLERVCLNFENIITKGIPLDIGDF